MLRELTRGEIGFVSGGLDDTKSYKDTYFHDPKNPTLYEFGVRVIMLGSEGDTDSDGVKNYIDEFNGPHDVKPHIHNSDGTAFVDNGNKTWSLLDANGNKTSGLYELKSIKSDSGGSTSVGGGIGKDSVNGSYSTSTNGSTYNFVRIGG